MNVLRDWDATEEEEEESDGKGSDERSSDGSERVGTEISGVEGFEDDDLFSWGDGSWDYANAHEVMLRSEHLGKAVQNRQVGCKRKPARDAAAAALAAL